MIYMENSALPP